MKTVLLLLVFLFCQPQKEVKQFSPEKLPSENTIKQNLSDQNHIRKLGDKASEKGLTFEEWKQDVRKKVTQEEISFYYSRERKATSFDSFDTDAIEKKRNSILVRLAWARMFEEANIRWKENSTQIDKDLLSKLNLSHSPRLGHSKSKWTIIEWSDFYCTFCKQTYPHTQKILDQNKGQIFYIHKDFPLDADSDEGKLPLAFSRCLWNEDPSHYQNNVKKIYNNINNLMEGTTIDIKTCLIQNLDPKYLRLVNADYKEAKTLGIDSIPTFWVNGRWIVGSLDEKSWAKVLNETMLR